MTKALSWDAEELGSLLWSATDLLGDLAQVTCYFSFPLPCPLFLICLDCELFRP